jgi:HAD superfamily hydrolase (TIGR01549 family)
VTRGHPEPLFDTVVLDVDGTLVDSNYLHTRAWQRAFSSVGLIVPAWRIHRAIGMGGERLVPYVTSDEVEDAQGDAVRAAWEEEVDDVIDQVEPFAGASDLLRALKYRGLKVVLATSGKPTHTDHAMKVLEADDLIDHLTTSEDVDASKPAPNLLTTAREAVGGTAAVAIGDSVWDAKAAGAAGMRMVGVLSGGSGCDELVTAGAEQVYADVEGLAAHLDSVLVAHPPVMSV